jgi:hypothetical protein
MLGKVWLSQHGYRLDTKSLAVDRVNTDRPGELMA